MQVGFAKAIITPWRGVPLAGYFNPRPNVGVLDDIHVRCILFKVGRMVTGIVALDVCMLGLELVDDLLLQLKQAGFKHGQRLIFSATHTHTAPYTQELFGTAPDAAYMAMLRAKVVESVLLAERNLAESTLRIGSIKENPEAYNRRYWMRDGGVTTNPGVKNPAIVKPEGPVDREIGVLCVEQAGRTVAVLANIVNHTDTVGEALVSADWPGRLEREVQGALGHDALVVTLIGCSGNVNQFDVSSDTYQGYSYERTCVLGASYAHAVVTAMRRSRRLAVERIKVVSSEFVVPYRVLEADAVKAARATLRKSVGGSSGADLTSEGLASGAGEVAHFFARQLLEYHKRCSGKERTFKLLTIAFDTALAVTTLPGEPFTEIGLRIKRASPFKRTWPVALAMGACGYIPLPECFARGGYETLPVVGGAPREDTATRLMAVVGANLRKV